MDQNPRILSLTPEIDTRAAEARMTGEAVPFLLDVREPFEFAAGHIPAAVLIPLGHLAGRLAEVPRDREILCICRSGARSLTATRQLQAAGYRAVNLGGGMLAWNDAGLPVERGQA